MAVPTFSGSYTGQNDVVDTPVTPFDVSAGWTDAKSFDIAATPPGFGYTPATFEISGTPDVKMFYTLFVRGVNDDGKGAWEPLQWDVTGGAASTRTLYGLGLVYQQVHPLGTAAVLLFKQRRNAAGSQVKINDIPRDGTSADYDAQFVQSQVILNGVADTQARATVPGWEIIIDTAV